MAIRTRPSLAGSLLLAALPCTMMAPPARAQEATRRVVARTAPTFPELARRMHLSGKVKLEAVIAPAGSVTSAKLIGGNPVFESSAVEAIKQWKFESAARETKAVIVLEFGEP